MNPRDLLKLIVELAPQLQQVGVERVELEGVSFTLRPGHGAPAKDDVVEDEGGDPLDDPATFGIRGKNARPPRMHGGES